MSTKFTGTFEQLKQKLSKLLDGEWDESQSDKKVFKYKSGLMNWFPTTGLMNFQGKDPDKSVLEQEILKLLETRVPVSTEPTLERQYLTAGINEGELIIGIVSAVGTETSRVTNPLKDRLKGFGYEVEEIRVSAILPKPQNEITCEYKRIKFYMSTGDQFRADSQNNAILATGVAQEILKNRASQIKSGKKAYIVISLKHPSEVEYLRKIYADGFYLIGIHADEKRRYKYLTDDKRCSESEAKELIKIDEDERLEHGQKTRDTYHLSDFFINLGKNDDIVKNRLQRFLELIFSHPYKNPTFDEFAMFMAFNSSVRSGDLSRQVGAVISRNNQIIATGANDVPRSGGGLYWAEVDPVTGEVKDQPNGKDYTKKLDSNKNAQSEIIKEITQSLLDQSLVASENELNLERILKESKISDLTEFGRVVHAEMDALLSCSRAGIPTAGVTLYCTTFPCHNCAKHIIAGGIKRVVYVEPYPKSRALDFHSESIQLKTELDAESLNEKLVTFEPFIGVGPRRFLDLFSMNLGAGSKLKRKTKDGKILDWDKSTAPIRTPLLPKSYLEIEQAAIEIWKETQHKNV